MKASKSNNNGGSLFKKKAGGVKAPIPFRPRSDLYNGGKMKRVPSQKQGASVLQTYLNVVPEQKALVESTMNAGSSGSGGTETKKKNDSGWLSNLNVYIDPTSASSFMNQPAAASNSASSSSHGSSKKTCSDSKSSKPEVKWTSHDDPGLWREFLIVLFMISIVICVCFGAMSWVLKNDPPSSVLNPTL